MLVASHWRGDDERAAFLRSTHSQACGFFDSVFGPGYNAAHADHLHLDRRRAYFLDGAELRSVSVGRLADVETAFAMTVHKSQGSEFAHVVLVLPPDNATVLTRELVYTGITRAKAALTLVAKDGHRLVEASRRLTQRLSGLGTLLNSEVIQHRPAAGN